MCLWLLLCLLLIFGSLCNLNLSRYSDFRGVDASSDTAFRENLKRIHGKSYIITTKKEIPRDAFVAATKVGFQPILFPATRPTEREFESLDGMYQKCLPEIHGLNIAKELSYGEIALICSHRRVLETIVNDTSVGENDWSLVLEDDVKLHPWAWNISESLAQEVISIADHNITENYGFIYFGVKINRRQRWGYRDCRSETLAGNSSIAIDCSGHGTHAFAVTKTRARTFIKEVYRPDNIFRENKRLQIDQVFSRHFIHMYSLLDDGSQGDFGASSAKTQTNPLHNYVVGWHLESRERSEGPRLVGLIYQSNVRGTKGTSLTALNHFIDRRYSTASGQLKHIGNSNKIPTLRVREKNPDLVGYKALLSQISSLWGSFWDTDRSSYIGIAYVITTKRFIPQPAATVAKSCGFRPVHFAAVQPKLSVFPNRSAIYYTCIPHLMKKEIFKAMKQLKQGDRLSLGEVALICSHRRVLESIATHPNTTDSDWALVLEDDATLHPDVPAAFARQVVEQAIEVARKGGSFGFMYLGFKKPRWWLGCRNMNITADTGVTTPANHGGLIAADCNGFGTHAYAVTKERARVLFNSVYNESNLLHHGKALPPQIDQVYNRYFDMLYRPPGANKEGKFHYTHAYTNSSSTALHTYMLGMNKLSPENKLLGPKHQQGLPEHLGIVYQGNLKKGAKQNAGSTLKSMNTLH